MSTINNIAILIFSNSSLKEASEKRLHISERENREIHKTLFKHTLKTVKQTGIPYFIESNYTQKGASFADRITHAAQKTFAKGYDKIIVVGGDSPNLSSQTITRAASISDTVIGPSKDGGIYLLSINKQDFVASTFCSFSWKSSCLSAQLISFYHSAEVLPSLLDIDTDVDFKIFQFEAIENIFFCLAVFLDKPVEHVIQFVLKQIYKGAFLLRGPPEVFA